MAETVELAEGKVFTRLTELLPAHTTLYIGNSMPVRDLDTFFSAREAPLKIWATGERMG